MPGVPPGFRRPSLAATKELREKLGLPARYFVSSLQTLFLAGDIASVLVPDTLALLTIASVLGLLLVRSTRMRLE